MIAHINALNGTAVGKTVAQKASSVLVIVDQAVFRAYDHIWIEVSVEVGEGGTELFAQVVISCIGKIRICECEGWVRVGAGVLVVYQLAFVGTWALVFSHGAYD